jgi:hypothetical protein
MKERKPGQARLREQRNLFGGQAGSEKGQSITRLDLSPIMLACGCPLGILAADTTRTITPLATGHLKSRGPELMCHGTRS